MSTVGKLVQSTSSEDISSRCVEFSGFRWLGQLFLILNAILTCGALVLVLSTEQGKLHAGLRMTRNFRIGKHKTNLATAGVSCLPGLGPRDQSTSWLEIMKHMTENHGQR